MNNLMEKLDAVLTPIAGKLDNNRYLSAVKNSFMAAMPLLIIGSFFTLFANLPIPGYSTFMAHTFGQSWQTFFTVPNNISMSMMTVYVIIGIANELAHSYKLDRMGAIFAAIAAFFVLTPMIDFKRAVDGIGVPLSNLGASGLFVGILVSILAVELVHLIDKWGWTIKMPDSVPENVSRSFSSLIPIAVVILVFNFVRMGFAATSFGSMQSFIFTYLQTPLTSIGASLPATLLVLLIEGVLWSFGIHGANIVGSVMTPIWLALTAQNAEALANGTPLPNIVDYQFYNNFVKIGGSGATMGLVLLLFFVAKSKQMRAIGRLAIFPEIFTINEPIIFGMPIVLNPVMLLPFILTPLIMVLVAYGAMAWGLVPLTNGVNIPWTTPPIISGFLVSGWRGALLNVFQIVLSGIIYYPFFRTADRLALKTEKENENEIKEGQAVTQ
ncbi:MAG: PTS sugar transporter subunit IIC [Sporolactobacillus sp.]